jgi:hypothetical protein
MHTLGPEPATVKVEPKPPSDQPLLGLAPASPPPPRSTHDAGAGELTLEPLAVAVENDASEKREEPAPKPASRPRALVPMVGLVIVLVALVAVGTRFFPAAQPSGAVLLETTPSGARVVVNGEPVGQTPWAGQTDRALKVILLRDGYEPKTLEFDAGAEWTGVVKLQRKR